MSDKKTSTKHTNDDDERQRDGHRKSGHRRDSRHSPISERHSKSDSYQSYKNDRNVGHSRRHDNRSNDRSKRRDYGSDRRDSRRDDRNRRRHGSRSKSKSRSRSRSRSKERHSHSSSSRREDNTKKDITKKEPTLEKVVTNDIQPEKGIQQKNNLEIMRQQIKEKTGISVPEYYNPGVVNPIKFAEQEKKRKLLWSREDTKPQEKKSVSKVCGSNPWNNLKFEGEKGNAMTEKFRKLMGIKDKDLNSSETALNSEDNKMGKNNERNESAIKSQETLFKNLDLQYSIARISTHTQRGVGLGFGASQNYNASSGDK